MGVPTVTVVVCTRDRGDLLLATCEAVLRLPHAPITWELLVVDNGSTDGSVQRATAIAGRHAGRMRVVRARRPGLSRARNVGVAAATGEIVAFLDDDAKPSPTWLPSLVDAFSEARTLCAGGPVLPLFSDPLPTWVDDRFLPYLSAWDRGRLRHDLAYNEYPRGANVAYAREAFHDFGRFHPALGRRSGSLRSCEEIEICLRIERGGFRVVYEPGAQVEHYVSTRRLTEDWMVARFAAQGFSEAILEWRHAGFRGIDTGWRRSRRIAGEPASTGIQARCHRAAADGYLRGALWAPVRVRRYRRDRRGRPAAPWLPFR